MQLLLDTYASLSPHELSGMTGYALQPVLGWAKAEIARLSTENTALHATVARLTRVGTHCENERQGSCRGFKAVE